MQIKILEDNHINYKIEYNRVKRMRIHTLPKKSGISLTIWTQATLPITELIPFSLSM